MLDSWAISTSLGKAACEQHLEPASGDGMIYIPQSGWGLSFLQGPKSRCWQGGGHHREGCWTVQPLSRTCAAILHLGYFMLTSTFVLTVLRCWDEPNLSLQPNFTQGWRGVQPGFCLVRKCQVRGLEQEQRPLPPSRAQE